MTTAPHQQSAGPAAAAAAAKVSAPTTTVVGVAPQVLGQSTVLVNALPAPLLLQQGVVAMDGIPLVAQQQPTTVLSSPSEIPIKKKGTKKRKSNQAQTVASMLQQHHHHQQQLIQQQQSQTFQAAPMLQALTLVPSKPAGAQLLSPAGFNLLQPVNIVPNVPTFQQFIVPGLGGMVMGPDGTATLLPTAEPSMQLQIQNVNGQNVLTQVPGGLVIRAPTASAAATSVTQAKPTATFQIGQPSPIFMNTSGTGFGGQLSPLVASVSPSQLSFKPAGHQEFLPQTLMVPCSIATQSQPAATVVQHNTTIVQQQTTMVSQSNGPTLQYVQHVVSQAPADKRVMAKHSVSTQTAVSQPTNVPTMVMTTNTFCQTSNGGNISAAAAAGSPPDTTTHSPPGTTSAAAADTTDGGLDAASPPLAPRSPYQRTTMVHCVSSSNEHEMDWPSEYPTKFPPSFNSSASSTTIAEFNLNSSHNNGQRARLIGKVTPATHSSSNVHHIQHHHHRGAGAAAGLKRKHTDAATTTSKEQQEQGMLDYGCMFHPNTNCCLCFLSIISNFQSFSIILGVSKLIRQVMRL